MKKKASSQKQQQQQQTVLSRFFQVSTPKKLTQEEEEDKKKNEVKKKVEEPIIATQTQERDNKIEETPIQTQPQKQTNTEKKGEEKITQTQKQKPAKAEKKKAEKPPPKKRLRKVIDDDDEDYDSGEESDDMFDDNVSDEDYSSGDNEDSYSSDEDEYESDVVSEEEYEKDSYRSNSESDDDILSDEDIKPKSKSKTNKKKATSIEDFENKYEEDNNDDDDVVNIDNKDDNANNNNIDEDEDLDDLTTQTVGLKRFSNDSNEEVEFNEKRHKTFVNKLRRIQSEKDAKITTATGKPKYTPMEQQVVEMKKRYPDCILAFEVGYKFSLYGRDAEIANEVLKVYCYQDHNFLTTMIPTVRLNFHLRRLVQAGYKVGLVRQTEVAAIKALSNNKNKPFTRSLTDLYTPATLVGSDLEAVETDLSSSRNYMVCIYENIKDISISFVVNKIKINCKIYFICYFNRELTFQLETLCTTASKMTA